MTKKQSAEELVRLLHQKVQDIKLNDAAAIFGTTSKESMLQNLRKSVAELGSTVSMKKPYDEVMKDYEKSVGEIDAAGITGLISETELADYYTLIDSIWVAIEREKSH
jgi:hypothetical protein